MNEPGETANPLPAEPRSSEEQGRVISVRLALPAMRPWVTYTLLATNIIIFLLQMTSQFVFGGLDFPAYFGMKINEAIIQGQFWRLLTPVFLHGSIMHIGFNSYAIYIFGRGLERHYGHWRYLLLYGLGALGGNVFSFLFSPNPSLGASTAVFAMVAAEGIFIFRNRFLFGGQARSMLINILTIVAINLALGLSPGIDNWGHLGGLVAGLAFAWFAGPVLKVEMQAGEYIFADQHGNNSLWLVSVIEAAAFSVLVFARIILGA